LTAALKICIFFLRWTGGQDRQSFLLNQSQLMSIIIWKNSRQLGPFSEREILERLSSGELSSNDFAWTAGHSDWKPLSTLIRLDSKPPPPSSDSHSDRAKGFRKISEKLANFCKVVAGQTATIAELAKAQAYRAKLELIDLNSADHRIGKKAFDGGSPLTGHHNLVFQLVDLQIGIGASKEIHQGKPTTFGGKTKAALAAAASAVKRLLFPLRINQLLLALGAHLRQTSPIEPALATEIRSSQSISSNVKALETKIKDLKANTYWWARRPLWIAGVVLISIVLWMAFATLTKLPDQTYKSASLALSNPQKSALASPPSNQKSATPEETSPLKSSSSDPSSGASQDINLVLPFAKKHFTILRALYEGDVKTLYQSNDLGEVFLYIIALHTAFRDRAPDLYDQGTQLQLAAAFAKFGISGHNIENVLDTFLRRPNDFLKGGVESAFDQKGAEWEAATLVKTFGADGYLTKKISAGVAKFAEGSMAAMEEKYQPATDGSHPSGVSDQQFKEDPTAGKKQIERFDDVYKYYDAELIQPRAMGNRYAIGYTLSRTPPNAEVDSIEEFFSVFQRDVLDSGEIISRGQTIPRAKVVPVPPHRGDYLDLHGDRVFGEPYYYSPPSTASDAERNGTP
jgi:GYF domain 2